MRAIVYDHYGPSDVLRLADVPKPVTDPDQSLVRIHAATVTGSTATRARSTAATASRCRC